MFIADKEQGMRHLRRWSVLVTLAWMVHVPVFSSQAEMPPCEETLQATSMPDCQVCATCVSVPASVERTAERDDSPVAIPPSWVTQFDQQAVVNETMIGTAVRHTLPLRVLYCRWLN
ncbi:MAG: hypothetical protein A3K04_02305 [Gallionellales bacterium RBG_16_56_9]|nr:MAG: hypothetical protein A3K04_02305 [Gallionellales bacterium RBG_16_56_9]